MLYFETQTTKPFIVLELTFTGHSRSLAMVQSNFDETLGVYWYYGLRVRSKFCPTASSSEISKKNRHFGPSHQLMQMKTYTENQKGSFVHPSNNFPENFRYPIKNVARDRLAQGYRSTNTNVVALRYRIGTGCAIRRRRLHT